MHHLHRHCGQEQLEARRSQEEAVSMGTPVQSALKRARLEKNLTLEEAVALLNAITGGTSDTSQLSAWESGRRRTGLRNRRGLCDLYDKPSDVLFAHQDGQHGVARALHQAQGTLVTRWTDLVEAMTSVVTGAREHLVVTGSRSREKGYLDAIETAVAQNPDLVHTRVLYGPPRHHELVEHLTRLMELRDPAGRRNGARTLSIGIVDRAEMPERFFVASERRAVVPLPSLHSADGFDCGIVLEGEAAAGLVHHGREACAAARLLGTIRDVRELPVRRK
ncbi:XRE family transcriptional regulator [Streptomyces sp. NPDC046385]|uniref:XRE family transcriptional regulator n=1 Tax=Streptomyces sp. NPDC046385 TaxID=3154918 RepID=UPI0033C86E66